jgi:hypothetical protein
MMFIVKEGAKNHAGINQGYKVYDGWHSVPDAIESITCAIHSPTKIMWF